MDSLINLPFCNGEEPIGDGEDSLCRPANGELNLCQFDNSVVNLNTCTSGGYDTPYCGSKTGKCGKARRLGLSEDDQGIEHMIRELQDMSMSMTGSGFLSPSFGYSKTGKAGRSFTVLERVSCNSSKSKSGKGSSSKSGKGRRRLSSSSKSDTIE